MGAMKRTGHYGIPLKLCILMSLFSVMTSLTPPRILYGGWKPILPGHPFHFGSARRKYLDQLRHQEQYSGERIPSSYHQQNPIHEVEHHFEHHVEFVEPQQHRRPQIYSGPQDHAEGHYTLHSGPSKNAHAGYQSAYRGQSIREPHNSLGIKESYYPSQPTLDEHHVPNPIKGQHAITYGHKSNKDTYNLHPPQTAYEEFQIQKPVPEQHITYGHKSNKGTYNFHPPQTAYKEIQIQKPVSEQHISYGHKPNKNIHDYYPPQSAYDKPPVPKHVKEQQISYGHKPNKNIFGYYPPQSIYDEPKQKDPDYKPVYFEIPRKPLEVLEIPKQKVPYILNSVKDIPIKGLNLQNINQVRNLGEKTFLKITPLDPGTLKVIGETNLGTIKYLNQQSPKFENYPIIKDSSGGISEYPRTAQHAFSTYGKHNVPAAHPNYGINGIVINSHSGNGVVYPINDYKRRPLNPIETKNYRNPSLYTPQILQTNDLSLKLNSLSSIPKTPVYSAHPSLYSTLEYPSRHFGIGKQLTSPVILNNNLANQVKNYLGQKMPRYQNQLLQPFYPKAPVPTPYFRYPHITKPLVHIPPLQTVPKLLPKNYLKMQTLYKNPGIVASVQGTPSLVEREVAIIHVPVTSSKKQYPVEKEYLFYTASTPESTHVLDNDHFDNRSVSTAEKAFNGKNKKDNYEQSFSSENSEENQRGLPSSEIDDNRVDGKVKYHDTSEYIYVSGTDIQEDPEAKKQFFHAYYAAADHVPPPGYVRMTLQEFDHLFHNAEIRYVDKDPTNLSSQDNNEQQSS